VAGSDRVVGRSWKMSKNTLRRDWKDGLLLEVPVSITECRRLSELDSRLLDC
jgi:hypothetical protein